MNLRQWHNRSKLAVSAIRHLWTDYRRDRPQLNSLAQRVGFPTQPTGLKSFLADLARIPTQIVEHEKRPEEIRSRLQAAEPFLQVARVGEPANFEWSGDATLEFPNRSLPGRMTVSWRGARVEGTHQYFTMPNGDFVELSFPQPGRLHGEESYGEATIEQAALKISRISGEFGALFPGQHTTGFSARALRVGVAADAPFHRYIFRGGRLKGWQEFTERATFHRQGLNFAQTRDSFNTLLLGRRARITQIHDDEINAYPRLIGVTIEGRPLDDDEQHVLWLTICFLVGMRLQTSAIEHYDANAALVGTEYLSGVEYGATGAHPPFDLRLAHSSFNPSSINVLAEGFSRLVRDEFPLAIALHHLHDANTEYTQVELKNLLFCVHTLFEAWTDVNDQRYIEDEKIHARLRRQLDLQLGELFGHDPELYHSVRDAIKFAYRRVGAVLQEIFFDALSTSLTPSDVRALRKRNPLFHNGYIIPKKGQGQLNFLQELIEDAGTLRTLAHEALLKLSGYRGTFFDYRSWSDKLIQ
jgi:hypothetical protein